MEKRALIAVAVSFVILLVYQFVFIKPEPQMPPKPQSVVEEKEKTAPIPQPASVTPPSASVVPQATGAGAVTDEKEVRVETELYSAVFSTKGGVLKQYELKKYKDKDGKNVVLLKTPSVVPPLAIGSRDDFDLAGLNFHATGRDMALDKNNKSGSLLFEYSNSGISIKRTYTFYSDSYKIDIKDDVSGVPYYWVTLGTDFGIFDKKDISTHIGPVLITERDRLNYYAYTPKTFLDFDDIKENVSYTETLKCIAQEDKYFFSAIAPVNKMDEAKAWKLNGSPVIAFKAKAGTNNYVLYAGPKEYDGLKALGLGLEHIVDFGFFSIIALPLFWILKLFHTIFGNYGWSIVLLTIVTRIPFIPLISKSQKSMKKMQEIQPRMAEVKEKYKKDPQRMQKEMMELYKTHKVNPVGGCLPMILQIPVFFALYKILMIAIELRGAPFMLWITDLAGPDTLLGHIPSWFPLIGGFAVGPLPILMGATMIIQQKMTPTSMDPMQNRMMMFMPVIFTFMFLNFASGLVLYWLVNNLLSIGQQFYVNQKLAKEKA